MNNFFLKKKAFMNYVRRVSDRFPLGLQGVLDIPGSRAALAPNWSNLFCFKTETFFLPEHSLATRSGTDLPRPETGRRESALDFKAFLLPFSLGDDAATPRRSVARTLPCARGRVPGTSRAVHLEHFEVFELL